MLCLFVYKLCVFIKNVSSFKSIRANKIQKENIFRPSLEMLCKRLKNHLTMKLTIFYDTFFVWSQIIPSFMTKRLVRQLCLHFWGRPGYVACWEVAFGRMSLMRVTLKASVKMTIGPSNQNQTHELQEIKPKHDHYIVTWLCRGISGIREDTYN